MIRVATDIGGTFTDIVYYEHDEKTDTVSQVTNWKCDTVPEDLTAGVMTAIDGVNLRPKEIGFFAHGTTVVINAIAERKGARTGLITTAGFRDVLEIARGNRPDLFNFRFRKPPPFVPRYLRLEVEERTNHRGEVLRPLDVDALAGLVAFFQDEGVEALAVSFLHAYANPANEVAALDALAGLWPEVPVVASHQTTREWREYERTNTAVLSAYVSPVADRYLSTLESRLQADGMNRPPYIMQSNGGVTTVPDARANPIAILESGPASGVLGAAALAQAMGRPNVIALDIGGTTAKCSLIEGGKPAITTDYHVEADRENPGYPIKTPVIDIVEIGTGGGSIAWIDEGGRLFVGPRSAGANPGPVVYGRGGVEPTVTDAHVLTGRIDGGNVLGREGGADVEAAGRVYGELGAQVGVSADEMAHGVLRIADVNMENALKLVSINRGHDPRDFALVVYGGGGPLHGATLATALNVPEVIIPANAAVFSAWGMLQTDLRRDYIQTGTARLDDADPQHLQGAIEALEDEARHGFSTDAANGGGLVLERAADMRYRGQEHTVKVSLPGGPVDEAAIAEWIERFRDVHDRLYRIRLEVPAELVNFHLTAYRIIAKPPIAQRTTKTAPLDEARIGRRRIDFGEAGVHETPVYERARLRPGMALEGPAIAEERGTGALIWPGQRAEVDGFDNVIIRTGG
ncbi:MAG: hydantoinase/oxoprolinase family protein [Rhodospirillales bacterium]|jgi:N-methylhydantoinase A|nr:hydantoinase/oxoprolinase family protein [Rhodospirillales bacterium]MDP6884439.1 hydantoinase/oxoprolinase family protein [Rhodospirillales bacterium]